MEKNLVFRRLEDGSSKEEGVINEALYWQFCVNNGENWHQK
jgi:hypothetical protein